MALNSFLISFLLHVGVVLPVTAEHVYSVAGSPVTLSCPGDLPNQNQGTGAWRHNGAEVLKYSNGKPWKVNQSLSFKGTEKGDFPLEMPEAKEGLYTCDVSGKEKSIHLHVLKVTGSPEGAVLQGESLELQLHPPDLAPTSIKWIGPHTEKGHRPRWNQMDNNQRLQIKDLQIQDSGIWKCFAQGQTISYQVTVIGFLEALDEEIFAAVNSTVTLSYTLNVNLQNGNYLNTVEVLLTQETLGKSISLSVNGSCPSKTIAEVQFEDGGRYQCCLRLGDRWLNKTIRLIVMKVFASPPGPLLKEREVKLCCNTSAPPLPGALLRWDDVNRSANASHCLRIKTAGQRTCRLVVGEEVKISMNYTVEALEENRFPLTDMALGAGVSLVLVILVSMCLFTYVAMKRKKQRAERMAQAKQHLLAKRTCQCHMEKSNDYYHT